jgi:CubicO group peptidase (beta-lactamase class C family)
MLRHRVWFSLVLGFLVCACSRGVPTSDLAEDPLSAPDLTSVEASPLLLSKDDADTRARVLKRMADHQVPGMSIAVIQDGAIALLRSYAVVQVGTSQAVTEQTRFQAASISKPVTALATLRLVQQCKLDLDGDLNHRLKSWKIPANEFTQKKDVTVRQILTHSAGFTVHGFGGYAQTDELPSLLQILDGKPPANSPAIRVDYVQGSAYRYSSGGYCVLQQALIDISGRLFAPLMEDLVWGHLVWRPAPLNNLHRKVSTLSLPRGIRREPLLSADGTCTQKWRRQGYGLPRQTWPST